MMALYEECALSRRKFGIWVIVLLSVPMVMGSVMAPNRSTRLPETEASGWTQPILNVPHFGECLQEDDVNEADVVN